ncbi:MAG: NUDIX hydrolase [Christensenellales bacterium]|jgi:ADP-ribose pyrophosphatase YjhB (NUDIX family)
MLFRTCAGGVVFYGDSVLLLQNEKNEWVLPKGLVRPGFLAQEVAVSRVNAEAGVTAEVIGVAGQTSYEFYSLSRQKPVCNEVTWFMMRAASGKSAPNKAEGFKDGGFFPMADALRRVTYSQDRALITSAYERYKKL